MQASQLGVKTRRMLSTVVHHGNIQQVIEFMENSHLIKTLSSLLETSHLEILKQLLAMLLQFADKEMMSDTLLGRFREVELDTKLVNLLEHLDDSIHASTYRLLEIFFPEEVVYLTGIP